MEIVYERCCGLDVHKDKIVACVISARKKEIKTFSTMTQDLLDLVDWIKSEGCQCVAMESTGVYWKPIYNLLELEDIQTLVVNAQHIKTVPGRKTDVKDTEWIADLLRHGLLKGSFIQNREARELKELIRYRRSLIEEKSREINRIQKILEGANIKLSSVVSEVTGVSGKLMLKSIIKGENDPKQLAALARGKMKRKTNELEQALNGLIGEHQKKILSIQLNHIEQLDETIGQLDVEVKQRMLPFEEDLERIDTIVGIGRRSAETIIAEIGVNMNIFPTAAHLASWAGLCPGHHESAGKKKSGKTRKGSKTLRSTLVECAIASSAAKDNYLKAQFKRICSRRGKNRASIAVAHSILVIIYNLLKNKMNYQELGFGHFDSLRKKSIINQSVKRLTSLGYKVTLEEIAV